MVWTDELLDRLSAVIPCGYQASSPAATEPTALATLALLANHRFEAAAPGLTWLAKLQGADGSLGATTDSEDPKWPTSLAVLAWQSAIETAPAEFRDKYRVPIAKAINWITDARGNALRRDDAMGHDTTIVGWPWVIGTHSWLEPTCFHVLALKATGNAQHVRARDGLRLVHDRLLSNGGCNYGNTLVLGQELRPHVQPTGIAMTALAGHADADGRIQRSLEYLTNQLPTATGAASLAWAVIGLAAHGQASVDSPALLERAYERTVQRQAAPLRLALLALAALGAECPLHQLTSEPAGV